MTTSFLHIDIAHDEGFRTHAYPDPKSGGEPWTVGYGSTGPDIGPDTVWTEAQASARLDADIEHAKAALDAELSWWRELNDARQDVLVNMTYNMGIGSVLDFHHALGDIEHAEWPAAMADMLHSEWAIDVGARAHRLAEQMLTGVRIPPV